VAHMSKSLETPVLQYQHIKTGAVAWSYITICVFPGILFALMQVKKSVVCRLVFVVG
jgi:hypothetical protein